ncbi:MAG TPA: glycosyl hydrolase family 18 protein [Acidobacteriaceae bacterium]
MSPFRLCPRLFAFVCALLLLASAAAQAAGPQPPHSMVVGYLPQWGLYSTPPWLARELVQGGGAELLDQVNYAQGGVRGGRCVIADPEADLNHVYTAELSVNGKADLPTAPLRGGLHQLQLVEQRYPRLRAVISLEGQASEFAVAAQPANRAAFVASCVDMFVRGHLAPGVEAPRLFEGVDVDWEFPHGEEEGANYMALLAEFRRQLDAVPGARRPVLTVAAGPGTRRYPGVDWAQVAGLVDQVGLMNYDYNGPWQQQTGMNAPLYPMEGDPRPQNTVDGTVAEYEAAGVPGAKLLLGVPFYGYHWEGVAPVNHGLFQPGQSVREDRPYRAIATLVPQSTIYRDERSQTPWLYDGHTFWTFDDPVSAAAKARYAAGHGLAGVMVWELSGDTADAQMLRAIRTGLKAGAAPPPSAPSAPPPPAPAAAGAARLPGSAVQ